MTTTKALPTEAMYTDDHAEQPTEPVAADRLPTVPPTNHYHQSTDIRAGTPLGSGYLLDTMIGSGATGRVWRGRRRDTGAPVAVKVLREEFTRDQEAVIRFLRQRTALRTLDQPHLVKVHDLVTEGDVLAVVMDLVDGDDLRQVLRQQLLRPGQALVVLEQVAGALAAVHAAGVVHRDVKPENVLVQWRAGEPYALLTDFGLAGLATGPTDITRLSMLMGTPAYVAPELVTGRPAVPASDVYALGVMAYELLTGQRPYQATNTAALLHAHVEAEPDRPARLAEPLWALVRAMLAKSPEARPVAGAVGVEIGRLRAADSLPPPLPPPPAMHPSVTDATTATPATAPAGPVLSLPPAPAVDVSGHSFAVAAESAVALPTTGATRPAPAPPPAPQRRRRWGWLVTAAGTVAVLGTAIGVYLGQDDNAGLPPGGPAVPPPQNYYLDTHATTPERGQAQLVWDEGVAVVEGFQTYAIFRRDTSDVPIGSGPDAEQPYLIAGLDQETQYCWYVVAIVFSHDPPPAQYAMADDKLACVTPNGDPETP